MGLPSVSKLGWTVLDTEGGMCQVNLSSEFKSKEEVLEAIM